MLTRANLKALVGRFRWRIVAIAASILVILIILFDPSFKSCIQANQQYQPDQHFAERLRVFVGIRWWCVGAMIDANGVAITAFATIAVAWFTFSLRDATKEQGRLTQKAIGLARDEFNATHRPKIVIRGVSVRYTDSEEIDTARRRIGATIKYFNKGRSPATVKNIRCKIFGNEFPLTPNLMAPVLESAVPDGAVDPGIGVAFDVDSDVLTNFGYSGFGKYHVLCLGCITYLDARGLQRETGFVRVFNPADGGSWVSIPKSGYDYSY